MADLQQLLAQPGIIIMDGATGTQLQKLGLPVGMSPELWNLQNPAAVQQHHQAYVEAGSAAILTNTFGGTRLRLEQEHAGDQTHPINVAAAQLARAAAGNSVLVLGSMGPTGAMLEPFGPLTYAQAVAYFAEQAAALAAGGVDGLHIETFSDLQEAKAAIEGARQATRLPVTVTMSFDSHGRTLMGVKPEDAVKFLLNLDVLAVGVNCGRTLSENLVAITAMRATAPTATLIAKPNAGLPQVEAGGELIYQVTPADMAEYALKFKEQNVKMFGGCCGSTPAHIAAIKQALVEIQ